MNLDTEPQNFAPTKFVNPNDFLSGSPDDEQLEKG